MDKNLQAVAVFDKRAQHYALKYNDITAYQAGFRRFCHLLPSSTPRVLDVACGPGNITRFLADQLPGADILGIDLAPNMIEIARKENPAAHFRVMDARQINTLATGYDGIMCGFCLPYLSPDETTQLIAQAAALLAPGGVLYLSTMEGTASMSGPVHSSMGDEVYLYYHHANELRPALAAQGFVIDMEQRQAYNAGEVAYTDLILIAVKP